MDRVDFDRDAVLGASLSVGMTLLWRCNGQTVGRQRDEQDDGMGENQWVRAVGCDKQMR
jgi:hypothetical protein